jgi:hypothetical protein
VETREPVEGPREGFQEVKGMAQGPGFCPEGEEGVKEKRAKNTRKKVNEEATLVQKAKMEALKNEALDFYRQLIERGLKPFEGASIDFHRKRDSSSLHPKREPNNYRREERGAKKLLEGKQRQ